MVEIFGERFPGWWAQSPPEKDLVRQLVRRLTVMAVDDTPLDERQRALVDAGARLIHGATIPEVEVRRHAREWGLAPLRPLPVWRGEDGELYEESFQTSGCAQPVARGADHDEEWLRYDTAVAAKARLLQVFEGRVEAPAGALRTAATKEPDGLVCALADRVWLAVMDSTAAWFVLECDRHAQVLAWMDDTRQLSRFVFMVQRMTAAGLFNPEVLFTPYNQVLLTGESRGSASSTNVLGYSPKKVAGGLMIRAADGGEHFCRVEVVANERQRDDRRMGDITLVYGPKATHVSAEVSGPFAGRREVWDVERVLPAGLSGEEYVRRFLGEEW